MLVCYIVSAIFLHRVEAAVNRNRFPRWFEIPTGDRRSDAENTNDTRADTFCENRARRISRRRQSDARRAPDESAVDWFCQ